MALAPKAEERVGRALTRMNATVAIAGAAVLFCMALVTGASIAGRALAGFGLQPVRGDFELVEMGSAIAVFAFLPWCQMVRGHVSVDVFALRLPARWFAALGCLGDLALSLCSGVILWRMWLGFVEKFPYGGPSLRAALGMGEPPFFAETTYDLQMPVWIPFGLAMVGAALFFITCLYSVWRSLNWTLDGTEPSAVELAGAEPSKAGQR